MPQFACDHHFTCRRHSERYNRILASLHEKERNPGRVSVVLPTYNTARYIGEALNSVFAQSYSNYEVIVVNDGSPDTPELERVLAPFSDRISYIKKGNGGVASARNTGIRASTGDFIATLDSDDLFEPDWMKVQVEYLQGHPDVDLVYGDGIVFGNDQPERLITEVCPSTGEVTFEALVTERCCVPTSGMLVRREAIFGSGLLDENLRWGEDFDMWLRIVKGGYKIAYHRQVIFRYRRHAGGVSMQPTILLRHSSSVLTKMLERTDLTPEERAVVLETRKRFEGRILFHDGKDAFEKGNFGVAVDKLAKANGILRQPRLTLTVALLRMCPRVVWHARKLMSRTGAANV
jgi:glycosyltransferase involved in cell wall biosynthesis